MFLKKKINDLIKARSNQFISYFIKLYLLKQDFYSNFSGLKPTFIKVGANDGLNNDPCGKKLIKSNNWSGALIEPVPDIMNLLKTNYVGDRFNLYQIAISDKNGESDFYTFNFSEAKKDSSINESIEEWMNGISSFKKENLESQLERRFHKFIKNLKVNTVTLENFIKNNIFYVPDFLHIDTEGHDLNVLKSINIEINQPKVILLEVAHLSNIEKKELYSIFKKYGYWSISSNWDTVATLNFFDFFVFTSLSFIYSLISYFIYYTLKVTNLFFTMKN